MFSGCNVENASYGLTTCAERCAIFKAASEGMRGLKAVVVTTDVADKIVYPCGACRQVIAEFGNPIVVCVAPDGSMESTTMESLLPKSFGPADLMKE
mmetsp:Transcript_554/g.1637  ORF Transcript_554/g.1637 Transcript_554/m.1637 type:complete len:97 (+) Transcript_554:340-630(+)